MAFSLALSLVLSACSSIPDAAYGRRVAQDAGCLTCHTDNTDLAPTWHGLWNSPVTLEDGTVVVADDVYLLRSVEDPSADIVSGYDASMPVIPLNRDEKAALIAYIRSLGR